MAAAPLGIGAPAGGGSLGPWISTRTNLAADAALAFSQLNYQENSLIEVGCLTNSGQNQGTALYHLQVLLQIGGQGHAMRARYLAASDEYYDWWHTATFPSNVVILHFCTGKAHHCQEAGAIVNPVHVDRSRSVAPDALAGLNWLSDGQLAGVTRYLAGAAAGAMVMAGGGAAQPPAPIGAGPAVGQPGSLAGLQAALGAAGAGNPPAVPGGGAGPAQAVDAPDPALAHLADNMVPLDELLKRLKAARSGQAPAATSSEAKSRSLQLRKLIGERVATAMTDAIQAETTRQEKRAHRKSKKQRKSDASSSSNSDSHDEELFREASLVQGSLRVHRAAQRSPGLLAQSSLVRMRQYLAGASGALPSAGTSDLPSTMSAYLNVVYFPVHPETSIGLRASREMKTIGFAVDLMCQGKILEALDFLTQRQKALEVSVEQGNWVQAKHLELIPQSDVTSWSRSDLKAAQKEQLLDTKLGLTIPSTSRGSFQNNRSTSQREPQQETERKDSKGRGRGSQGRFWKGSKGGRGQQRKGDGRQGPGQQASPTN